MSSPADARPRQFTSALGWPAAIDSAGTVTVQDDAGQLRATYQGTAAKHPSAHVPAGGSHIVRLPTGEVELFNGKPKAKRRRDHNGHLDLYGRRYEFLHVRRWNTEVTCDGVRVAVLHRRFSRTFTVRVNAVRDDTDLLATVLCWYAVRPGRAGAISAAFDGL
ncbi:hypothetical protein [Aeromicrobium sp. UC242_57]|uniref:hypothetical protein n=1 Tax=Aeromicrobium sp. UC242_57 TaxID=3374624 RepID=UPI0037967333